MWNTFSALLSRTFLLHYISNISNISATDEKHPQAGGSLVLPQAESRKLRIPLKAELSGYKRQFVG